MAVLFHENSPVSLTGEFCVLRGGYRRFQPPNSPFLYFFSSSCASG